MSPVFVLRSHPDSADLISLFQNSPIFKRIINTICLNLNNVVEDTDWPTKFRRSTNLLLTGNDKVSYAVNLTGTV